MTVLAGRGESGRLVAELAGGPGDTVVVRGSSGVATAWGLHHYLTQFTHCHVRQAMLG